MSGDLQAERRLKGEIGNYLTLASRLDSLVFQRASDEVYHIVLDFLLGKIMAEDLRIEKELLSPADLRERIAQNISESSAARWVDFSVRRTSAEIFPVATSEIARCIGGFRFAAFMVHEHIVRDFFLRCLSSEDTRRANWLVSVLSGSLEKPDIAAEIVYEFVQSIRDAANERSVLVAFLEGFSVQVGTPGAVGGAIVAKWDSKPMLQALINTEKAYLAQLHEDFIRLYLAPRLQSDDSTVGQWQRRYDQHFQLLINLRSGMFHSGVTYEYGR